MKVKANNWLDTESMMAEFGIDVFHNGQWLHAAEAGKPLFFKTPEERDAKMASLRKAK